MVARARFYHAVCDAHMARIVRVDLKSELFSYSLDEHGLAHARLMDGKLLLVTNATIGATTILTWGGTHHPHPIRRNGLSGL